MTTYRVIKKDDPYTRIDRVPINDENLSFRARGILIWLLDKPDNWTCNSDAISRQGKEGREAVRTAINELLEAGYLVRSSWKNERGQFETATDVHERPVPLTSTDRENMQVTPETGFRSSVTRIGKLGAKSQELSVTTETKTTRATDSEDTALFAVDTPTPSEPGGDFEEFWKNYPRRVGKTAAKKAWGKALEDATADEVIAGAQRYAQEVVGKERQYVAHPSSWLNAGRWEDETDSSPEREPLGYGGAGDDFQFEECRTLSDDW